jgi:hypothetical protein
VALSSCGTVFVRDFILVDRPFQVVAPRFVGRELPIEALAHDAIADAWISMGPAGSRSVADGLECTRGTLRSRGDAVVVPMRFVNASNPAGPASLEGELEVVPVGERTELGFEASYRRAIDDPALMSMRRVTEVAVRAFLQALGRALET